MTPSMVHVGTPPQQRSFPDASGARPPTVGDRPQHNSTSPATGWQKLVETLLAISTDLSKEEDIAPRRGIARSVKDAINQTRALVKLDNRSPGERDTDERLIRIEASLENLSRTKASPTAGPKGQTWAAIAATQATRSAPATSTNRAAVRIRLEDHRGTAGETLAKARTIIPEAYAIRTLKSGDIDVLVPTQTVKDRVLNQPEVQGCKVLRQEYPIEIPGVPFSIGVTNEKSPGNEDTIRGICEGMRRLIPSFAATKIRWLHDPIKQAARKPSQTRGTLILGLPTQDLQYQAVRKGVIIDAELYEVRLFEGKCVPKQCYRCCQWGHSQTACKKQARCGHCAGHHDTRDCPKTSVSCANCGRKHKAWQRRECKTYQTYRDGIDARKAVLYVQSATLRTTSGAQPAMQGDGFQLVAGNKRPRLSPPEKRGVGRPSFVTTASRDALQTRLTGPAPRSQQSFIGLPEIPTLQPMDDVTPSSTQC